MQRWRNVQVKSLCRLEVDHKLETGRVEHWKIGWLGTFENPTASDSRLTIGISNVRPIAHQAARVGEFSERIDCWNFLLSNEGNYLLAPNHKERICADQQRTTRMVRQCCYGGFQLV